MRCEVRQWLTTRVCDGKTPVDGAFLTPAQGSSAIVVGFPMPQTFSELPVHHPELHQLVTASDLGAQMYPRTKHRSLGASHNHSCQQALEAVCRQPFLPLVSLFCL